MQSHVFCFTEVQLCFHRAPHQLIRNHIRKLFNGESESPTLELDDSFDDTNRRFVRIQEVEIGEPLKRMREVKRWALMVFPLRCGDA